MTSGFRSATAVFPEWEALFFAGIEDEGKSSSCVPALAALTIRRTPQLLSGEWVYGNVECFKTTVEMTVRTNTFRSLRRFAFRACGLALGLLLICSLSVSAQGPRENSDRDPDRDARYDNGVNAGGNWTEFRSEDAMTAAKRVRFELPAENVANRDDRARIVLYCTDGKLKLADFHPGARLSRPDWPGFWGQPQMRVRVRADDAHDDHNWNWVRGHFLAMDKGTARELIGAHLFRIEYRTPDGPQIAEFSPAGLDLKEVDHACGLKPKRP